MAAPSQMNPASVPEAAAPRQFKKHRVLPRPHIDQPHEGPRRKPHLASAATVPRSSTPHPIVNPQPLKHQLRRINTGPDLPPTPPAHSNASSSSHSAAASSPTSTENSVRLPKVVAARPPATPPDQRSPPTPDVTPPQPASLAKNPRPSIKARMASGSTQGPESRTESFITAREELTPSEDEAGRLLEWPRQVSATSQRTVTPSADSTTNGDAVRPVTPSDRAQRTPTLDGERGEGDSTPKAKGKAAESVDRHGDALGVGHSQHTHLSNAIMSQQKGQYRRRPSGASRPILHHDPVVEDKVPVAPTDATKAVRNMSLEEAAPVASSSQRPDDRKPAKLIHPQVEATAKRERPLSTSSQSTVVEVLLVDGPPKRQRTLRHMRKQSTLRDAAETKRDAGLNSLTEVAKDEAPKLSNVTQSQLDSYDRESYISTVTHSTNRSISSRTARREIWKSGAIPVVIVPDRRSSRGPKSREPSLRSASSRHSDKARSVNSAHARDPSPSTNSGPIFERPARRSRAYSESDRSERTIDFPPSIPQRSSSLSAPTSRNASRPASITASRPVSVIISRPASIIVSQPASITGSPPGSLTASCVKVHSAEVEQQLHHHCSQEVHIICPSTPSLSPLSPLSPGMEDLDRQKTFDSLGVDQHDDVLSVKKIPLRNTPFSVASMETVATAPELVEALAVHMFPHQNSSVVMVDHSNRPSEALVRRVSSPPSFQRTHLYEQAPATPPQKRFSSGEVDSPLRNPRAPPQPPRHPPGHSSDHPPAINFIPATPSGMTPAAERVILQGNYFESLREKPPRRPSIVRRAFSRRRHSVDYVSASRGPGFLARTFSLSRRTRDDSDISLYKDNEKPSEEDKLHPFWRPQWISDEDSEPMDDNDEYSDDDDDDYERDDEVFRYPPVDNRPRRPTRSFSQKVKQTFSIMPQEYHVDDVHGPQRRTIKRTSSGNLRIVRRRISSESMRRRQNQNGDPRSIVGEPRKRFWRRRSLSRGSVMGSRRFSIGSKLGEIQNIPQKISERRREKRTQRLRSMISGPKEVRDGVGEVIRPGNGAVQVDTGRQF